MLLLFKYYITFLLLVKLHTTYDCYTDITADTEISNLASYYILQRIPLFLYSRE